MNKKMEEMTVYNHSDCSDDDFDFSDIDIGYYLDFGQEKPFVYYYEEKEIIEQWHLYARMKGVPGDVARLTPEEANKIMTLFAIWKELFGFPTLFPFSPSWDDMDTLLHIHHFDLLLELYFNFKFRNLSFRSDYPD